MKTIKVGTKIRINHMWGEDHDYDGREGIVTEIDDMGTLHGTWGGLGVIEDDDITILDDEEESAAI